MPSIEAVRAIVKQAYGNVEECRPDILRARQRLAGKTATIGYFDCSEDVPCDIGDLRSYQENLLGEEYFRMQGALQWNLYLYFVVGSDTYSRLARSELLQLIQADLLYARKFVVRTSDLLEELRVPLQPSDGQDVPSDFLELWSSKLGTAGLGGLLRQSVPATRVVERYLESGPFRASRPLKHSTRKVKKPLQRPRMITGIHIKRFRPCLDGLELALGPVTLVSGPNGSGKTSLLEAIEAWFCGRTQRDPDAGIPVQGIGIRFEGSSRFSWNRWTPGDYRARELSWYGVHRPRRTSMPSSFRRFNFFWTDAAVQFAESHTESDMSEALSNLVVGEEASVVEKRAKSALGILRTNVKELSKQRTDVSARLRDSRASLTELRKHFDRLKLLSDKFTIRMKAAGWCSEASLEDVGTITVRVLDLIQAGTDFEKRWPRFYRMTQASLARKLDKIAQLHKEIRPLERKTQDLQTKLLQATRRCSELDNTNRTLRELAKYLRDKDSPRMHTLSEDVETLNRKIANTEHALKLLKRAPHLEALPQDALVGELVRFLRRETEEIKSRLAASRTKLEDARQQFEKKEQLGAQVRATAKKLLAIDPSMQKCPVCGTIHAKGKLSDKLREQLSENHPTSLEDLETQFSELRERESGVEQRLTTVQHVQEAYHAFTEKSCSELEFQVAVAKLSTASRKRSRLRGELSRLQEVSRRLQSAGLSEARYRELTEWFSAAFQGADLNLEQLDALQRETLAKKRATNIKGLKRKVSDLQLKQTQLLKPYLPKEGTIEPTQYLEDAMEGIREQRQLLDKALLLVSVDRLPRLNDVIRQLRLVYEVLEQTEKKLEERPKGQHSLLESARQNVSTQERELSTIGESIGRAQAAISVLEDLVEGEYSKESYMQEYIQRDIDYIGTLFRHLCAPREFSGISFADKTGDLRPIRASNRQSCAIAQISSNQRSALALSVFMSLNGRLAAGPPYVLLDDPVAHADDLNTLSLLDYLRVLVASQKRQIIFATANRKVATLFRRKMEVLGCDVFREIRLGRQM